ncbi:UPF0089-domain-containing protein [Gonapodya prolifera JEL478]|uniref:UPF0089-domain-containing protein n=1 Tax=Gonapodya prolifera (strain JEL478) TaxID=1344416 RepID=A0A139A1B9_GONPJ|nr:UPF0089-domain-containing protein [Gonapodya prolifera JEL478]|eukprot:KXS10418.1 UPF0089-domain-containing protein [Gonapodya prolifera JEL478]
MAAPAPRRIPRSYLSGLDIVFGGLASPNFAYIAGVAVSIYDPPFPHPLTIEHVRATLRSKRVRGDDPSRVRFLGKLVREGDPQDWWRRPYFEGEAKDFKWEDHVVEVELPSPGTDEQLRVLASDIQSSPLDVNKPLWKFYLVKGLEGGRMATIDRCHHAIADGEGMVRSLFADERSSSQYTLHRHVARSNPILEFFSTVWAYLSSFVIFILYAIMVQSRLIGSRAGLRITQRNEKAGTTGVLGVLGSHPKKQVYYGTEGVDLNEVKAMKDALGVSLNDVVLGLTGRACDRYLRERGAIRDERMNFGVPVSARAMTDNSLTNKLLAFTCLFPRSASKSSLPLVDFIHATAEWMDWQKALRPSLALQTAFMDKIVRGAWMMPSSIVEMTMAPSYGGISNVPGPAEPIKWGGATISRIFVANPISHASPGSIGVAVMSYVGKLYFCIAMDEIEEGELRFGDNVVYEAGAGNRITALFHEEVASLGKLIGEAKKAGREKSLHRKSNARLYAHLIHSLGNFSVPIWVFGIIAAVFMAVFGPSFAPKRVPFPRAPEE